MSAEFTKDGSIFIEGTVMPSYTGYRAVAAEGARIGLLTCLECGAVVMLDPDDKTDFAAKHLKWHESRRIQLSEEGAPKK